MSEQVRQEDAVRFAATRTVEVAGAVPAVARALRYVARVWWNGWVRYARATYPWR